ncbi:MULTISPECIES: hypothetical protein [unclassified Anabaena]|uniref:hypothetical protein n=1 Tax=unclassified Anabaena TaxID=2619674 RepID=UPI000AE6E41E|nr:MULTISPECIES: hypothetical protein [unclassified Anabaena]
MQHELLRATTIKIPRSHSFQQHYRRKFAVLPSSLIDLPDLSAEILVLSLNFD